MRQANKKIVRLALMSAKAMTINKSIYFLKVFFPPHPESATLQP